MKNFFLKIIYRTLAGYARKVIKDHTPYVIAITGSVGKSSTKEAIYQVFHDRFGDLVRKNYGNLNAEIGIPLTILGYKNLPNKFLWPIFLVSAYFRTRVKEYPKYLILEWGVEHRSDIDYFKSIVRPDVGVITWISPAHLANFKSYDELVAEKMGMMGAVKEGGKIFINADNPELSKVHGENILKVGIRYKEADYTAGDIILTTDGMTYRINTTGQKITVRTKTIGEQLIYADLFAFALGQQFEIQSLKIKESLEKIKPINGRMRLVEGKRGIKIIDDTYNANPAAVKAALLTFSKIATDSRRVAIIGNMNELGNYEKSAHQEVAEYAKGKCDLAIFAGPNANLMASTFGKDSLSYKNRLELLRDIDKIIKANDLVLIKASQNNNFFEEVTKALMAYPADADKVLVRQDKFWKKRKR